MIDGLGDIPGLHLTRTDGAFYAFPCYDADLTAVEMVAHLRSHGVAVRPGSEFAIPTGIDRIRHVLTRL